MKKQDISPSAITAGYLKRQRRYILTTGILLLLTLSLAAGISLLTTESSVSQDVL